MNGPVTFLIHSQIFTPRYLPAADCCRSTSQRIIVFHEIVPRSLPLDRKPVASPSSKDWQTLWPRFPSENLFPPMARRKTVKIVLQEVDAVPFQQINATLTLSLSLFPLPRCLLPCFPAERNEEEMLSEVEKIFFLRLYFFFFFFFLVRRHRRTPWREIWNGFKGERGGNSMEIRWKNLCWGKRSQPAAAGIRYVWHRPTDTFRIRIVGVSDRAEHPCVITRIPSGFPDMHTRLTTLNVPRPSMLVSQILRVP